MAVLPRTLGEDLSLDFVNSRYQDHRTGEVDDRLPQRDWQQWFLERGGFELEVQELPLARLREARGMVRAALERWSSSGSLPAADIAALDRLVGAAHGTQRVVAAAGAPDVRFVPDRRDWVWVIAEVAAAAARLTAAGDGRRLKRCGNPACSWLFYDQSHNSSRRWCDVATCGNLVKVREFRARQRASRTA